MVFLRTGLTVIAGLALTKALVKRTQDEPNTPNILPALPNDNITTTDLLSEGELERGRKGFGL